MTAAAIIPLAFAWIGDAIPYERRQPVLGRFLSGQISGMVLGQVFAGIIAEHAGWRYVFVLIAALFVIAGVALAFEVRGQPAHPAHSPEPVDPVLKRFTSMLREPWVLIVLGTTFLEGMIFFGAYTFVGSYIWARFGLGLDLVGLIVAGFGVGGLVYAASAGRLFSLLGETGLMLWGGILRRDFVCRHSNRANARRGCSRDCPRGPQLLHDPQHFADPCDANGAGCARVGRLHVR